MKHRFIIEIDSDKSLDVISEALTKTIKKGLEVSEKGVLKKRNVMYTYPTELIDLCTIEEAPPPPPPAPAEVKKK